jgi:hypothetical protein
MRLRSTALLLLTMFAFGPGRDAGIPSPELDCLVERITLFLDPLLAQFRVRDLSGDTLANRIRPSAPGPQTNRTGETRVAQSAA